MRPHSAFNSNLTLWSVYFRNKARLQKTQQLSTLLLAYYSNTLQNQFYFLFSGRDEDGARALPPGLDNSEVGDLRSSVASLVDAMRDLLNNIRLEVPNDADAEGNDDSADDDDLT